MPGVVTRHYVHQTTKAMPGVVTRHYVHQTTKAIPGSRPRRDKAMLVPC